MKTKDFIFKYSSSRTKKGDSFCRIRIFKQTYGDLVAILTDVGIGRLVTDCVETIRKALIDKEHIDYGTIIIEHYEGSSFDFVSFDNNNAPSWRDINIEETIRICGSDNKEITSKLSDNQSIAIELEAIKKDIYEPLIDPDLCVKSCDVQRLRISKGQIEKLVDSNSIENSLQGVLKKDLSLLSEVYANPRSEYICFSEFPIGDGFADFVVFTGRLRMEVFVIEIKGADFHFSNSNSYGNMSSKINEAAQQIRRRLNYINANYHEFRHFAHRVREQVEQGKNIYNSLLGSKGFLHVDSNKDICVRGILIGGRCRDDLYESKLRHEFETSSSKIRVESWDSWLRKLTNEQVCLHS